MKPQRKDAGGRNSEQHPNHPQLKPSPVQSTAGPVHQESDSTATNEHAKTDHQLSHILICKESTIIIIKSTPQCLGT